MRIQNGQIFSTKCMANDAFSEPPRCADSKNPIFIFCRFLGLGHLRGPGVSLGTIWGVLSIEPFFGEGRGVWPGGSIDPPPPPIESPSTPVSNKKEPCFICLQQAMYTIYFLKTQTSAYRGARDLAGAKFGTAKCGTAKLYHILPWYLRTEATFLPIPDLCTFSLHYKLSITRFRGSALLGASCFHFEPCFTGELQGKQIAEL